MLIGEIDWKMIELQLRLRNRNRMQLPWRSIHQHSFSRQVEFQWNSSIVWQEAGPGLTRIHIRQKLLRMDAKYWIDLLGLQEHPEGGYYREVYCSSETVSKSALPERFQSEHAFSTSIYYLLEYDDLSRFHRLHQDEIWHFYEGSAVMVHTLESKRHTVFRLGRNPAKGQLPMLVIPHGTLFAAELENKRSYALLGCTVSPGFKFEDFDQPSRSELTHRFPEHHDLITRLTSVQ